jgi:hypothetical protein
MIHADRQKSPGFWRKWYLGKWLPIFDILVGSVLTIAAGGLVYIDARSIDLFLCKDGTAIYGAFLPTLAALLGFAITAISIIAGLVTGRQFAALRASAQYDNFWLAFLWSIRALAFATAVAFVALFANSYAATRLWVLMVALLPIFVAAGSLARSGYTLEQVLKQTRQVDKPKTMIVDNLPEVK